MITNMTKRSFSPVFRMISCFVLVAFTATVVMPPQQAQAQTTVPTVLDLPAPGTMVGLTSAFTPPMLRGVQVNPDNPLDFEFLVDDGDAALTENEIKQETEHLVKYFLAALTTPQEQMWVNLNPAESDRIVAEGFDQTQMGRDLLAQDYVLKQLTSSLMYPDDEIGKKFWSRVHKKVYDTFGVTNIPSNAFNKVWIVPEKAVIHHEGTTAVVGEHRLKVMMESDYFATQNNRSEGYLVKSEEKDGSSPFTIHSSFLKDVILPEIEKEVNEGAHFAKLRQIYTSMILATWYKKHMKESLLSKVYVDQSKTNGVNVDDPDIKHKIYNQYVEAYKKGTVNLIKEEVDPVTQTMVPKKYFAGGADMSMLVDEVLEELRGVNPQVLFKLTRRYRQIGVKVDLNGFVDGFMDNLGRSMQPRRYVPNRTLEKLIGLVDNEETRQELYDRLVKKGQVNALAWFLDDDDSVKRASDLIRGVVNKHVSEAQKFSSWREHKEEITQDALFMIFDTLLPLNVDEMPQNAFNQSGEVDVLESAIQNYMILSELIFKMQNLANKEGKKSLKTKIYSEIKLALQVVGEQLMDVITKDSRLLALVKSGGMESSNFTMKSLGMSKESWGGSSLDLPTVGEIDRNVVLEDQDALFSSLLREKPRLAKALGISAQGEENVFLPVPAYAPLRWMGGREQMAQSLQLSDLLEPGPIMIGYAQSKKFLLWRWFKSLFDLSGMREGHVRWNGGRYQIDHSLFQQFLLDHGPFANLSGDSSSFSLTGSLVFRFRLGMLKAKDWVKRNTNSLVSGVHIAALIAMFGALVFSTYYFAPDYSTNGGYSLSSPYDVFRTANAQIYQLNDMDYIYREKQRFSGLPGLGLGLGGGSGFGISTEDGFNIDLSPESKEWRILQGEELLEGKVLITRLLDSMDEDGRFVNKGKVVADENAQVNEDHVVKIQIDNVGIDDNALPWTSGYIIRNIERNYEAGQLTYELVEVSDWHVDGGFEKSERMQKEIDMLNRHPSLEGIRESLSKAHQGNMNQMLLDIFGKQFLYNDSQVISIPDEGTFMELLGHVLENSSDGKFVTNRNVGVAIAKILSDAAGVEAAYVVGAQKGQSVARSYLLINGALYDITNFMERTSATSDVSLDRGQDQSEIKLAELLRRKVLVKDNPRAAVIFSQTIVHEETVLNPNHTLGDVGAATVEVEEGMTLSEIAYMAYGEASESTLEYIMLANGIADADHIEVGQEITLPNVVAVELIARPNDSYWTLVKRTRDYYEPIRKSIKRMQMANPEGIIRDGQKVRVALDAEHAEFLANEYGLAELGVVTVNGKPVKKEDKMMAGQESQQEDAAIYGGIDLNEDFLEMDVQSSGDAIKFHMPRQYRTLTPQDVLGATPQVMYMEQGTVQTLPFFMGM